MITEIVLLLGVLCFLSVRHDFVHRKWWLVIAMIFWASSRILTELTFKLEIPTGDLRYEWGSLSACLAAVCLFLCLLCVFLACLPSRRHLSSRHAAAEPDGSVVALLPPGEEAQDASERLKKLVDEAE